MEIGWSKGKRVEGMRRLLQRLVLGLLLGLGAIAPASFDRLVMVGLGMKPAVAQGVAQSAEQRKAEEDRVLQQCRQDLRLGQQDAEAAVRSCNQALITFRRLKQVLGEARALNNLGIAYALLSQQQKAIAYYEQARSIYQQLQDHGSEAYVLETLGLAYRKLSQYEKAIAYAEEARLLYQQLKDPSGEASILNNLGNSYASLSQYEKAIAYFEQSRLIFQRLKDLDGEARSLTNLGNAYDSLSRYEQAIVYYERARSISQRLEDQHSEAIVLNNLGVSYFNLSQYERAITYYKQALPIYQKVRDRSGIANALNNLGGSYNALSQYEKAIAYYERALLIYQQIEDRNSEAKVLNSLGNTYLSLSQPQKAIAYYEQSLPIFQRITDLNGEAKLLMSFGLVYDSMSQYEKAITYYEKARSIFHRVKDLDSEARALMNLGNTYHSLSKYEQAIAYFEQAGAFFRQIKNRNGEASVLLNLGSTYNSLSQYEKAIRCYQQALAIFQQVKNRVGEWKLFNNLGYLSSRRQEVELAILFYKQSVNVQESIRQDLRKLSRDAQDAYTQSIAYTYRALAALLIEQGRIAEAQQVLELLKIQEINDVDPSQRNSPQRLGELALNPVEKDIQIKHDSLIAFGAKVRNCEQNCQPLETQLEQLRSAFKTYLDSLKTTLATAKLEGRLVRIDERNKDFIASASKIVNAQPNTVLIYPLVLPDKIHLLWASQGGVLSSTTCPIGEAQLNTIVTNFQRSLRDATDLAGVQRHGKTLYNCLIKPLEDKGDWEKNKIQNLVIAADRTLNYIPFSALYDGKQFLVQRYTISNILNAGLTDVSTRLPPNPTVLGFGISDALDGFSPLPNVRPELETLIRSDRTPQGRYPGSLNLNQDSTLTRFKTLLAKHPFNILHIATHGEFNPTQPHDSFLLLSSGQPGKGDRLTINRIEQQDDLRNIHLVVLSACQTAAGQSATTGIEIQGLSAAFVRDRAKAVIASLWNVNDTSTALLMQQFYQNLTQGMTKAEALRQAQLSLLLGLPQGHPPTQTTAQNTSARTNIQFISRDPSPISLATDEFSHPYYWAPFILIGNSL